MPRLLTTLVMAAVLAGCAGFASWETPRRAHRGAAAPARAPVRADETPARAAGPDEYVVRAGDTLYSIAFRHQLDFRELARLNAIGMDFRIVPGQMLKLKAAAGKPAETTAAAAPIVIPAPEAASSAEPVTGGFDWLWPTTGTVLRPYAPQSGSKGVDFTGTLGQPVFAAAPGRVVYSGNALKGYGELIIIKHNDTFLSAYGYNRKRHVNEGDVVTAGQPIAELGLGPENKPLLHFEIRERGQPVNPAAYLPKRESVPGVVGARD